MGREIFVKGDAKTHRASARRECRDSREHTALIIVVVPFANNRLLLLSPAALLLSVTTDSKVEMPTMKPPKCSRAAYVRG